MYLKSVGIHYSCMTTNRNNVKTGFAFYNEVLHQTSLTIKFNEVFRRAERKWICIILPPSIEVIRKKLKLEERQLTFPKSEIQIFQEFPSVCIED